MDELHRKVQKISAIIQEALKHIQYLGLRFFDFLDIGFDSVVVHAYQLRKLIAEETFVNYSSFLFSER